METNETSAEHPAETPAQGKKRKMLGCGCLIALFAAVAALYFFMIFLPSMGTASPENIARYCRWKLQYTVHGNMLRYLSSLEEKGCELPPDRTIPVLLQEMHETRRMDWKSLSCPAPGFSYRDPFLAFPVPASILLNPAQEPVPILMCRPGNHREFGTPVLYSDGTVKTLTTKEAEKLVAEQHPVPLEIKRAEDKWESEPGDEDAKAALERAAAE